MQPSTETLSPASGPSPCTLRLRGARPKGKRDRWRRWHDSLAKRISEDPFGVDLQRLSKPALYGHKWDKALDRLERLRAAAMGVR